MYWVTDDSELALALQCLRRLMTEIKSIGRIKSGPVPIGHPARTSGLLRNGSSARNRVLSLWNGGPFERASIPHIKH